MASSYGVFGRVGFRPVLGAIYLLMAEPVFAHVGGGGMGRGFASGFAHPLGGADHALAMLAVGLWGAVLGAPAIWLLPVVFPIVMAFGGALGAGGVAIPHVEAGIAISALLLGLMVAGAVRPPLWCAAILVGIFAIFHGHAHGTELPRGASALAYSAGFVTATGSLHLAGIALSGLNRWAAGAKLMRVCGGVIAMAGILFLWRVNGVWP